MVASLLCAIALAQATHPHPSLGTGDDWQTYVCRAGGFNVSYPPGWRLVTTDQITDSICARPSVPIDAYPLFVLDTAGTRLSRASVRVYRATGPPNWIVVATKGEKGDTDWKKVTIAGADGYASSRRPVAEWWQGGLMSSSSFVTAYFQGAYKQWFRFDGDSKDWESSDLGTPTPRSFALLNKVLGSITRTEGS